MKNISLLSTGEKDKPTLVLSLFIMVVFLSGPFSGRYFSKHPISYPSKQYNENHSGTYSCFISLHDSAREEHRYNAGEKNIDKPDTSVKGDTSLTDLLQKGNLNVVMW